MTNIIIKDTFVLNYFGLIVFRSSAKDGYIPGPGFNFDFEELKQSVIESIINKVDHKLVFLQDYIRGYPAMRRQENLMIMNGEPTSENLFIYMQQILSDVLPSAIKLVELKLYETKDSFARWIETTN